MDETETEDEMPKRKQRKPAREAMLDNFDADHAQAKPKKAKKRRSPRPGPRDLKMENPAGGLLGRFM